MLTAIKRVQAHQAPLLLKRLAMTIEILRMLQSVWVKSEADAQTVMLWVAAYTRFFGFLRVGEFTIALRNTCDHLVHLSLADLSIDSHSAPTMIFLRIKQSKTNPFRQGVDVFLGATQANTYLVKAMVDHIAVCPPALDLCSLQTWVYFANELHTTLWLQDIPHLNIKATALGSGRPLQQLSTVMKTRFSKCWEGGSAPHTAPTYSLSRN